MAAPILQHESRPLRRNDVLEGHAPFHLNFFCKRCSQFPSTYICICNRVRSVSFSDGEFRDHDIIFRDETDLVFCFLSCLVKFPALEANSWQTRAIECVFFSFFFPESYRFSIFSWSNAHTHTNKEGPNTRGKAERRQRYDLIRDMTWFVHRVN